MDRLTVGSLLTAREMALVRTIIAPQTINAMVGRISKSVGHSGRKKFWLRCVLLYTPSVSAEVPTITMADTRARTVRPRRADSTTRSVLMVFCCSISRVSNSGKVEISSVGWGLKSVMMMVVLGRRRNGLQMYGKDEMNWINHLKNNDKQ